ncbi:hypothetical protein [Sinisalibacter aestuarii]|uniref:Uncharacterized protein n=1 Tax=Sinisalibacter aestuarii TaxID=2949426 RepID=A0ABQ5LTX8_9RHOB|nr:hypothetical protein [Sinisalibacter aestuarii]GKY88083.1 hypothetical protein STA1M1_19520 [Sinisalibacter aestuarii]
MDLQARADRLAHLIEERLDIRGTGLSAKLGRGGRRLPRAVRDAGEQLLLAQRMAATPKLARQIDYDRIAAACDVAERMLGRIDPWERRTTFAVNWLAGNAFNLIVVAALALAVIVWRGLM